MKKGVYCPWLWGELITGKLLSTVTSRLPFVWWPAVSYRGRSYLLLHRRYLYFVPNIHPLALAGIWFWSAGILGQKRGGSMVT